MLNAKIQEVLNDQLNFELYSAYIYFSMAAYLQSENLVGMAHWMKTQTQEERGLVLRFYHYINERDGKVMLKQVQVPQIKWSSPLEAFEDAYNHECIVSSRIHSLVDLSIKEKDHPTNTFLQWFITEQVEEEASTQEVVQKIKLAGDFSGALFILDKELGQRPIPPNPLVSAAAE